ncbi:hypothetical protein WN944_016701 [Citrus x changshan-huyou]|uniref:Uncharacterized protein n=1 Tax=Citrus x changshan-huyou TaxID=2935761 RepID=A0AAP0QKL8_9ROSI
MLGGCSGEIIQCSWSIMLHILSFVDPTYHFHRSLKKKNNACWGCHGVKWRCIKSRHCTGSNGKLNSFQNPEMFLAIDQLRSKL